MIHPVEVGTLNLTDLRKIGMRDREGTILELTGKPGVYSYGVIVPGFWGRTTLQLLRHILVTKTRQFDDTTDRNSLIAVTQN